MSCQKEDYCIVVQNAGDPVDDDGYFICWNGYRHDEKCISLLGYAEKHKERLRKKYTDWVYELGATEIQGKNLIERLSLSDGFSLWWMSLFVEKSVWKSPSITDAIRIFALEEILSERKPLTLESRLSGQPLHQVIGGLCAALNITYHKKQTSDKAHSAFRLPYQVRGLLTLGKYVTSRWPLRKTGKGLRNQGTNAIFFCSYFVSLNKDTKDQATFNSRYWATIDEVLNTSGIKTNWLELYAPHVAIPDTHMAAQWLKRLNTPKQTHAFLDAYLSPGLVLRVFLKWAGMGIKSWFLTKKVKKLFVPSTSSFSLWPLMRNDWYTSTRGPVLIDNILYYKLFNSAMEEVPKQQKGFYLFENQSWEKAFIYTWRKNGHGKLFAVPHSTRSFWDMRFFRDAEKHRTEQSVPAPDFVVVNGEGARSVFLNENYPQEQLLEGDALRYLSLEETAAAGKLNTNRETLRIVMVGDYTPAVTECMLRILDDAFKKSSILISVLLKPHPFSPVKITGDISLPVSITSVPLAELLRNCDVVYCSNLTSASVDAYVAEIPVIMYLEGTLLNMSPLQDHDSVRFVADANELVFALQKVVHNVGREHKQQFLFLDKRLSRWQKLLQTF